MIFTGDILQFYVNNLKLIGVVEYSNIPAAYLIFSNSYNFMFNSKSLDDNYKVIGNIHDNPELLESLQNDK